MAQHELAVLIAARERASVAIDAQNGRGDFGAVLLHNQMPRLLALGTGNLHVPKPGDGWRACRRRVVRPVWRGMELIQSPRLAVRAIQRAVLQLGFEPGGV